MEFRSPEAFLPALVYQVDCRQFLEKERLEELAPLIHLSSPTFASGKVTGLSSTGLLFPAIFYGLSEKVKVGLVEGILDESVFLKLAFCIESGLLVSDGSFGL